MRESEERDGAGVSAPGANASPYSAHAGPDVARERMGRMFQFLREYHQIRYPIRGQIHEQPWHLWLRNLPSHPAIQWGLRGRRKERRRIHGCRATKTMTPTQAPTRTPATG